MTAKKQSNTPGTAQSASGSTAKSDNKMMLYVFCGIIIFAIIVLFFTLGGDKKEKEEASKKSQSVETLDGSGKNSSQRTARVYDEQQARNLNSNSQMNAAPAANEGLQYYTDPVSNVQMVKTPSGLVPVNSQEGRKYIEDFNALQAASGATTDGQGKPLAPNAAMTTKAEFTTAMTETNEQVKALDQKLNDAHTRIDELVQLAKKQNETIEKMSNQIRAIQPVVKSSSELAKDIFGKNGNRILKDRNKSISAASIVGNKAYIYDHKGDLHLVGVGDVVPGTSVKIKAIDQVERQVIVAE